MSFLDRWRRPSPPTTEVPFDAVAIEAATASWRSVWAALRNLRTDHAVLQHYLPLLADQLESLGSSCGQRWRGTPAAQARDAAALARYARVLLDCADEFFRGECAVPALECCGAWYPRTLERWRSFDQDAVHLAIEEVCHG